MDIQSVNYTKTLVPTMNSLKSPKSFIIRNHKRSGSNEIRNSNSENIFAATTDNADHMIEQFKNPIHAAFKDGNHKPLNDPYKTILEEKKSESSENSIKTLNINSTSDKESRESKSKGNTPDLKMVKKMPNALLSLAREKNNTGTILKKGDQIHFDAKLGDVVGEGAYGQVYSALNLDSGEFLAIKYIDMRNRHPSSNIDVNSLFKEIEVYQKLEHENIVKYIGAKQEGDGIYIYMEYMTGGSLASMLSEYGPFNEKVIRRFTKQVVEGLHYLHEKGVVHRDVKGGNILSDANGTVKLADFGAAKILEDVQGYSSLTNSEVCNSIKGSLYWMAPELLNHEKHGRKIDIWSLGCTIIEMATAKHPWPDVKSYPELLFSVMTKKCPPIPEEISDEGKDFIIKCCQFDKKLRPRTKELLEHPFLKDLD